MYGHLYRHFLDSLLTITCIELHDPSPSPSNEATPGTLMIFRKPFVDEFMKRMEEDSVERQRKRVSDEKEANKFKELGNKSFKSQEFESAIKHYSNAIDLIKDNKVYYTNRAQVSNFILIYVLKNLAFDI